ncbi:hypothetical protein B9479_007717 [Cryptococcus floricola]|uniref:Anaphase-promoting complex subunit 4 WD40 domain-containing protein n=1 Tax=Cryptococcus floricola TaxID=2591691 RepID=A0A5D3AJG0_9TREE|nr:hypothetical protein B9479_007717 [Cryptococcus floricola]
MSDNNAGIDAFPYNTHTARQLAPPRFSNVTEIRGLVKLVRSIAWSCDGSRAATAGEYKDIHVWDNTLHIKSAKPLPASSNPSPHSNHVTSVSWSPTDPNILLSADKTFSHGSVIAVWDLTSPSQPIATFKTPGDVISLSWHPSGHHFAAVYPMGVHDVVDFYRFSPSSIPSASSSASPPAGKWEKRTDIVLGGSSPGIGSEEINSLRFNNSGQLVCAVSNDGSIGAWLYPLELLEGENMEAPVELEKVESIAVEDSIEDQAGTAGGAASEAVVEKETDVDMANGEETGEAPSATIAPEEIAKEGSKEAEGVAAEAESEERVAGDETASKDDVEMTESTPHSSKQPTPSRPPSPALPPSADIPETATPPAPIPAPKATHLTRVAHTTPYAASLLSLSFDPLGRWFAVGGQDALLSLIDARDWICEKNWDVCTSAIRHTAFSSDGEFIAVGGDDLFIYILSTHASQVVSKIPIPATLNCLVWHPTKNILAWCHSDKKGAPLWYVVQQEV